MKSSLGAVVLLAFFTVSVPALAKTIPPPPPESQSTITKIDTATHEVSIIFKNSPYTTAKIPRVYTIDELTTITINKVPGKFADLRTGMVVDGTTERDAHTLDNLTVEGSGAAPAPATPKPAAKPKPKPKTTS